MFVNETPFELMFGMYQKYWETEQDGDNIIWKRVIAPPGSIQGFSWEIKYNVVLARRQGLLKKRKYIPMDIKHTYLNPGTKWNIVLRDDAQVLDHAGDAPAGTVIINNKTVYPANAGIGLAGTALNMENDMPKGASVEFFPRFDLYVGVFENIEPGQVLNKNYVLDPVRVSFPPGNFNMMVTARQDGEKLVLRTSYSSNV